MEKLFKKLFMSNFVWVVTSGRQLAKSLELQSLNDLGFSKRYVRCLQISEVVNSMKDLMDFCKGQKDGPIELYCSLVHHNPVNQTFRPPDATRKLHRARAYLSSGTPNPEVKEQQRDDVLLLIGDRIVDLMEHPNVGPDDIHIEDVAVEDVVPEGIVVEKDLVEDPNNTEEMTAEELIIMVRATTRGRIGRSLPEVRSSLKR
ncbi:hypothetical protein AgCh_020414 [Apium graveolens]